MPALRFLPLGAISPGLAVQPSPGNDANLPNHDLPTAGVSEANAVGTPRSSVENRKGGVESPREERSQSETLRPSLTPVAVAAPESSDPNAPDRSAAQSGREGVSPAPPGRATPASVPRRASDPNTSTVVVAPDPATEGPKKETTTELIGFVVRGRWLMERLQVDDLDSVVTPDGKRWLPLLRILHAFRFNVEEQLGIIRFTVEGVGDVELDVAKKQTQIRGQTSPIEFLQAVSEITTKADIYLSPEDLSKILDMELVWNAELYAYLIQLDRKLSIWDLRSSKSLLSQKTQYVEADLPEALPPANRSRDPLQLVELSWRPSYSWNRRGSGGSAAQSSSHVVNVDGPRETLWGNVENGQYKVQVSHPGAMWSNSQGWRWSAGEPYAAHLDWFEWTHRLSSAEVTVGDSAFGLSDLIYPIFTATGVRVNGLAGWTAEELKADRSGLGLRQYFSRTRVFEGPAPIGATAELIVNGRTFDVQKVFAQADSPPGMGIYRFEGIELFNGVLNEIAILIKEANGNETRVERSIMGAPQLLPKGRATYAGLLGSKRESGQLGGQFVETGDFYGYITGGKVLYGLTDRLTVGTILASQQDHYHRYLSESGSVFDKRTYPESSEHAGTTFSYLPLDNVMLSGDVAGSQAQKSAFSGAGTGRQAQESDRYSDMAARVRTEYLPTQKLSLNLDLLNLGSDFFDGVDPDVRDRRGGELGLAWKWHRNWTLDAGVGEVRNNLEGQLDHTTVVDYQTMGLLTTVLPRTALSTKLYNLEVSTEEDSRLLTEFGLRVMPTQDLSIYGQVLVGKDLAVEEDDRFLSLLRLPHAPLHLRPSQNWTIRKTLNPSNSIGLAYNDTSLEQALSFLYDFRVNVKNRPLRVHTEFIKELRNDSGGDDYGFRGRCDYPFDRTGYNNLGAAVEYRHGDYAFLLYLNLTTLFSRHEGRFTNITESRVRPVYGAVHGKVFLDYNGNHLLDANEPGVPNVRVSLGEMTGAVTDKNGYYILSTPPDTSEVRVYLDVRSVSAIYTVTHGTQLAKIYRDSLTEVNLSLAPLISIVGRVVTIDPNAARVKAPDPNAPDFAAMILDVADPNKAKKPVAGIRIYLSDPQSNRLVADSVTGDDGSYYLGDIQPGRYVLRADAKTLPKQYELAEQERMIEVQSTREEFVEISLPELVVAVKSEPETPDDVPIEGKNEKTLKADPNQVPQ
jgi:hypothetical protein